VGDVNLRDSEMGGFMNEWWKVGSLPDDNELVADLEGVG
jgi:hypothetical protein